MALKDVVDVQISLAVSGLQRVGFGTMMFVSEYASGSEPGSRVLEFSDADEADANADIDAESKAAVTAYFSGDLRSPRVKVGYKLDSETWAEALGAIVDVDDEWYALAINSADATDITDVATWVQARTKLFLAKTADSDVLDPVDDPETDTDIGSTLLASEFDHTALIYSGSAATEYPEMAWAGGQLPENPGSTTWAFKRVPGVSADVFTGAQITALEAKRVTRIENIQGITRTFGGYVSRPAVFVDLRRGLDYVAQRMAEDILVLLTSERKVPGDDRGSVMVENVIRARILQSIDEDIIVDDEEWTVNVPLYAERDQTDREARFLDGCTWTANLVGAVHKVAVRGEVSA
ncbi:MAG: hypothetical protein Unbinned3138contig1000_39 [Prokaryotic dsDNA virus sp.]|nr:MAG: hypothetical protein Unbinned3138contig1000_39 [Prokaryotic dsDNA virus sp.]|tara:strand:- start:8007 stop:9056 length:1050 start_codon:yes stop_codon:yes gene_type:complete